ncbi:hypothetical protein M0805_006846 [Coniferiporia weirii]|nr:hypothetical protein M0805_006846 [Coniferiporia weirii]
MPSLKIKVPAAKSRKGSRQVGPNTSSPSRLFSKTAFSPPPVFCKPDSASASRKKRRILSDNEDEREGDYRSDSNSASLDRMSQPRDAGKLFEDDANVDVVGTADDDNDRERRVRTRSPSAGAGTARKRNKKKATVVYSDEEDDYVDAKGKGVREDRDDDFISDSPPPRKGGRKGTGSTRGRGKASRDKSSGVGEIVMKDERKVAAETKAGVKRRRAATLLEGEPSADTETSGGASMSTSVSLPQSLSSASAAPQSQSQSQEDQPPLPKMRKLPTIKKNKSLIASGTPTSGPSTPSASTSASTKTAGNANTIFTPAGALPIHVSLPRKPMTPVPKTTDVDLFSPDIYASLFKGGSSAPRAGINPRVKEEERRKELLKMRDEAKAVRIAELQKNSFDLLAGQETVARFETKLREHNSAALFPNYLGSAIKFIMLQRNNGGG